MNRRTVLARGVLAVLTAAGVSTASYLQLGSAKEYDLAMTNLRSPLPVQAELKDIVRFATLAANSRNTQPWRFGLSDNRIDILPDFSRRTPAVDPDDHHLFISLGCAAENLALAAGNRGRPGQLRFDAAAESSIVYEFTTGVARASELFDAISKRQSTRAEYDGKPVSAPDLARLASTASVDGVDVIFITERTQIDKIRDLILAANTAQLADKVFVKELKNWLRFNPSQALTSGDGLYSATSGNPALPTWTGLLMFDLMVRPKSENDKYARQLNSSAGIVVFVAAKEDHEHWVRVGQASQRFPLQATALGLKHAFINQPVEVAQFRPELAALIGAPSQRPDILMRFGYGVALPYSARRPVEAVIV